ncbi:MAG: hypothetical protein DRR19_24985 [Candidatus Parabeggiatoa sp. nov. 1]|nr:MAG: hypothetical protein DRR19_24985 [Gammaproteobacteria bacterium]
MVVSVKGERGERKGDRGKITDIAQNLVRKNGVNSHSFQANLVRNRAENYRSFQANQVIKTAEDGKEYKANLVRKTWFLLKCDRGKSLLRKLLPRSLSS